MCVLRRYRNGTGDAGVLAANSHIALAFKLTVSLKIHYLSASLPMAAVYNLLIPPVAAANDLCTAFFKQLLEVHMLYGLRDDVAQQHSLVAPHLRIV